MLAYSSDCMYVCMPVCLCLSVCRSVCLAVCFSVCLSGCLFVSARLDSATAEACLALHTAAGRGCIECAPELRRKGEEAMMALALAKELQGDNMARLSLLLEGTSVQVCLVAACLSVA